MPRLALNDTCTGCMACMNACNKNAIKFKEDVEGFLHPIIDSDKCIECRKCEQSCPEVQNNYHYNMNKPDVYAGWNITDRCISSSGGAFSSVARYIISQGGVVYGATLDNLDCKHIRVENIVELNKLRGSKYVQSSIGLTYKSVKKDLISGKYVLFTGTPCQISGLLSFLNQEYSKLITMDLICHGVPSNTIFKHYIRKLENRLGFAKYDKIKTYEFRRRDGWGVSPSISTTMNNFFRIKGINGLYMSAFDKASIFRLSCYKCRYAMENRVGDFSIGDFWGLGHQGVPFKHDMTKGVSLLMVNTEKGRAIMKSLDENNFYEKRTLEEASARNHNLTKVSRMPHNRDAVIQSFLDENMSLDSIEQTHHLVDKSLKSRLSALSSELGIYDLLKKIYNLFS